MNKLSIDKRSMIVRLLVEGNSLRSCSRIADVSFNTVLKLVVDVGIACQQFHNDKVVSLNSTRIECDEIWNFVYSKNKNVSTCKNQEKAVGDAWTWTAIDADSKLIISWLVGHRDAETANEFMYNVASRLKNRVQMSTDGLSAYIKAVERAFDEDIDFAQLHKTYGSPEGNTNERKYSPPTCTGITKRVITGRPNPELISTSYVERQNLTMRMHMRRFTRLTNAFSKKLDNHCYSLALYFVYYNFCKVHTTLRVTPAMEAKLTTRPMTIEDIVRMVYADEIAKEEKIKARYNNKCC